MQTGEGDESNNEENKPKTGGLFDDFDITEDLSFNTSTAMTVAAHNNLEEALSLIEKTAQRVKPILEEVIRRMVPETGVDLNAYTKQSPGI